MTRHLFVQYLPATTRLYCERCGRVAVYDFRLSSHKPPYPHVALGAFACSDHGGLIFADIRRHFRPASVEGPAVGERGRLHPVSL